MVMEISVGKPGVFLQANGCLSLSDALCESVERIAKRIGSKESENQASLAAFFIHDA